MAAIAVREISVGGVRSPVRTAGPGGSREAIVFVHGNPGSSEDWIDALAHLGDLTRVIAPDMPGYGDADRPREFEYSIEGYARHLGGLIEHLGVDRVHLVLHDFGGPWGLTWAAAHHAAVASITLINIGLLPAYRWHKYARIWRTPGLGELFLATTTRGVFKLLLNAENPRPFPRAFADRMFDNLNAGTKRAILRLYRATSAHDVSRMDLAQALSRLSCPVLVLWGASDAALPASYARKQVDYFPQAEVHVLDGCGHWPFIDDPVRVWGLAAAFLRRHVTTRVSGSGGANGIVSASATDTATAGVR